MHPREALRAVGHDLAAELRRNRPKDQLAASGEVQAWHRTSGRLAEGRVSDISVQWGQATAARYVTRETFLHRSVSGFDPSVARTAAGGGGTAPDG
ncbi:hypothetical protein C0036_12585, partial [Streptomyces sp. DJ]